MKLISYQKFAVDSLLVSLMEWSFTQVTNERPDCHCDKL